MRNERRRGEDLEIVIEKDVSKTLENQNQWQGHYVI